MKITRRHLRRIIREATRGQLPYSMGGPWVDKDVPVGRGASRYDDLDMELSDKEIEGAMGWEPAQQETDVDLDEYDRGYCDGFDSAPPARDATADYDIGYEDGEGDTTLPEPDMPRCRN